MTSFEYAALLIVAAIAFAGGWYLSRQRFWMLGQLSMKEKIRQEVNAKISASEIRILYKDQMPITCEQLFKFICYGNEPDPDDLSHGKDGYTPN